MIEVKIYKDKLTKKYTGLRMKGHANYDVRGKDIVCAGVSTIFQSTILGLNKAKEVFYWVQDAVDESDNEIIVYNNKQVTQLLLSILYDVLLDLEQQYPANISVRIYETS